LSLAVANYVRNLFLLLAGKRLLSPQVAVFYVTARCNLNCVYCEDFGLSRSAEAPPELSLDEARHVLRVLRSGTDRLILTGGEPLLYPGIDALVAAARELGFAITLTTNSLLLPQHEVILPHLDRLIVSLDAIDPQAWGPTIGMTPAVAETLIDRIRTYALHQGEWGYQMIANCVLSPEALSSAQSVLAFCVQCGMLASFSPQAVRHWPRADLFVSPAYQETISWLLAQKRAGAPVLGSVRYLETVRSFRPFSCYPTLVPRVMSDGDLAYPCRPFEKERSAQGGRPCNLLRVGTWQEALQSARDAYGLPPRMCNTCYQQCYIEPSLMQAHPLSLLWERIRYRASRRGGLSSFVPG